MNAALEQRVRERAYEMWVANGKNDGSADQHWISAERAILSEAMTSHEASKAAKPRAKAAASKTAAAKPAKRKTAA